VVFVLFSQLLQQRGFSDGGFVGRNTKSGAWWVSFILTLNAASPQFIEHI
jgi:hypothetical protein